MDAKRKLVTVSRREVTIKGLKGSCRVSKQLDIKTKTKRNKTSSKINK